MSVVECVPNVSEGRRADVVADLANAFASRPGVELLHTHPDVDHNRTVLTAVGSPESLLAAAEELYERAIRAIDLREHRGAHPRVGAVDVCPFVPMPEHGSTMADCVTLARLLGERVAERFALPVFLYQEAATAPRRRDLSAIRRGQFEGLGEKLRDPDWRPDFGPDAPHQSAGATVVGARGSLIAYNIVLDSADLKVARRIAGAVRASSGGLPGIKAMGVELASRGLVQVSMNIEDPAATPIDVVSESVRARAAEQGVKLLETELVGLVPADAVTPAARAWLRRGNFTGERVLEGAIDRAALHLRPRCP